MSLNTTLFLTSGLQENNLLYSDDKFKAHVQLVNITFVMKMLSSLHEVYMFRNFVFYLTEKLNITLNKNKLFRNLSGNLPLVPRILLSNNKKSIHINGFLSAPSLCLVFTTDAEDPIMEVAAHSLRGVRDLKTLFVLSPILEEEHMYDEFEQFAKFSDIIRTTYEWIWKRQFLNTVLLTLRNNIYIHDPYPKPRIINKTYNWDVYDFFVDYSLDFKGYLLDTPVRYDLPRVFQIIQKNNVRNALDGLSGTSGQLFSSFIHSINATLNDSTAVTMDPMDFTFAYVLGMVRDKLIEISLHSYTYMAESTIGSSYPIGINDWCIMVPYLNRSPEHLYLERTFQNSTWILIIFGCFYLYISIWICIPPHSRDYSASILQAISSLIYIPPLAILRSSSIRIRSLSLLLFLLGFVISNMYVSKLASYLTKSQPQAQIDTVDDLIAANLKIMVLNVEYEVLASFPSFKEFVELLLVVDKNTMNLHRDNLNTSFGYSVQTDRWNFLNIQQRNLRKPLFRLSKICMGPFYHVFPMQQDSHFRSRLKNFLMLARQSGLFKAWEERAFSDALYLNYVRMITVSEEPIPLTLAFFRPIWYVMWFGLIFSGLVCIIEIKCHNMINIRHGISLCIHYILEL